VGLTVGPRAADGVFDGETFLHPVLGFHVRFPAGWKTTNERDVVGARAPDGRAAVAVELVGKGSDLAAAVRELEKETNVDLATGAERPTIGGLPAMRATARAHTRTGEVLLDLTWIAHADKIYRVTGVSPLASADALRPVFRDTAASFGSITADERERIRETRLQVVPARAGETLATLLGRTKGSKGTWSAEMTAVANALEASATLRGGQLVKVPVAQRYPS
jgi:predicted Zn-dependent protease